MSWMSQRASLLGMSWKLPDFPNAVIAVAGVLQSIYIGRRRRWAAGNKRKVNVKR